MLVSLVDRSNRSAIASASFRTTLIIAAVLTVTLGVAFALHWDTIYWGRDRSRLETALILVVVGAFIGFSPQFIGAARLPKPSRLNGSLLSIAVLAICLGLAYWSMAGALFSADEVTYQFQADTYRAGRLFNPAPPLGHAMGVVYCWVSNGRWVGQYPPGWPSVLAAFEVLGAPSHLANAAIILATVYTIWCLMRMRADRDDAWLAVLLFALSPFALFQGQSLFSHPLAGLLATTAMLFAARTRRDGRVGDALCTGLLIGALGITRTVAATAALAAVLIEILPYRRRLTNLFFVGLGGLPFAVMMLAFQYAVTGHPLEPVYYLGGRKLDHLYFDLPSIKIALIHSFQAIFELALFTSPFVPILWGISLFAQARDRALSGVDFLFPIGVMIFCFYPLHPGIRYGPRYWYDFWPMAIVTLCTGLQHVRGPGRGAVRAWAAASVIYGVVCTGLLALAFRPVALDYTAVYRAAARQRLSNAIVLAENLPERGMRLVPSDFARNGIRVDGPVLFVRETIKDADIVRHAYPGRSLWVYKPSDGGGNGVLVPLTPAAIPAHGS